MSVKRKRESETILDDAPAVSHAGGMHERIALLAYLKAEARGFAPGHELDDWLEAEREANTVVEELPEVAPRVKLVKRS